MKGVVNKIFISAKSGGKIIELSEVQAVKGKGLEGDRYFDADGHNNDKAVTLIDANSVSKCFKRIGISFEICEFRRNLVISGLDLNKFVGKIFRVGNALMQGIELCHPCTYLSKIVNADVIEGLRMSGGIRASVIESGKISLNDKVYVQSLKGNIE
jgi:MOSC domain-containing protein YiiM